MSLRVRDVVPDTQLILETLPTYISSEFIYTLKRKRPILLTREIFHETPNIYLKV